jgi:hypothetical protein
MLIKYHLIKLVQEFLIISIKVLLELEIDLKMPIPI